MARPYRFEEPGGIFHLATRSVHERRAFEDVEDRRSFLGVLGAVVECCGWHCLSYCLMGSHYHLIVRTPQANLSAGMQMLNGTYAQQFNRRRGRRGHLFGERFYSVLTKEDSHLFAALRYVARNPVEAGLCGAPGDWRWSSYRSAIGIEPSPKLLAVDAVLRLFHHERATARRQLARLIEGRDDRRVFDGAELIRISGSPG
jgi:putative transposase